MTTEASLVQDAEQVGRVGHEARGLLDGVPKVGFLSVHALVGTDALDSLKPKDAKNAGLHPRRCPIRVFMKEVCTSGNLLPVEVTAPVKMQSTRCLLASDNNRVALTRDIVDSLYR